MRYVGRMVTNHCSLIDHRQVSGGLFAFLSRNALCESRRPSHWTCGSADDVTCKRPTSNSGSVPKLRQMRYAPYMIPLTATQLATIHEFGRRP
jgi:hypothetical protein